MISTEAACQSKVADVNFTWSHKVTTDITNNTGEEMPICLDELGNQVAQNSHHINQMMQMLQQILRNQEQNIRTSHLEINDINPSTDA